MGMNNVLVDSMPNSISRDKHQKQTKHPGTKHAAVSDITQLSKD